MGLGGSLSGTWVWDSHWGSERRGHLHPSENLAFLCPCPSKGYAWDSHMNSRKCGNRTRAFSGRLVTPVVGITVGQAWGGCLWTRGVTLLGTADPRNTQRQQLVCFYQASFTIAVYFTNSHPESELPPSSPLAFLEKRICSLFSSAQLVVAS